MSASPILIGLAGAGGSGKDTSALILEGMGFSRVTIGSPLKVALSATLAQSGLGPAQISRMVSGDLKRTPSKILGGVSPTEALQALGDALLSSKGPEALIGAARVRISAELELGRSVVVESLRRELEGRMVKDLGGDVWRLIGRGDVPARARGHVTEHYCGPIDRIVRNIGTELDLRAALERVLIARHAH